MTVENAQVRYVRGDSNSLLARGAQSGVAQGTAIFETIVRRRERGSKMLVEGFIQCASIFIEKLNQFLGFGAVKCFCTFFGIKMSEL
jgi:hypothetical protein